ncbi:MAG: CbiX/SirB N-terminal domain-containing protein [Planctomycetota bacterium]
MIMQSKTTGVIICDHGSRRQQSNDSLKEVAKLFAARFPSVSIVEPAHMELAMPDIAASYAKCVEQGADHIVILPFFLARGKHWTKDIPSLTAQAAADHPGTTYQVAEPLGIDNLILDLLKKRLDADDQPVIASGEPDPRLEGIEASSRRVQCNTCPFVLNAETGEVTIKEGSGVIAAGVRH